MANKTLLIGWDAADWEVINPLIEAGKMPALQYLIERGVSGNLATLEPVFSPMLWTSIATGKRADKHGVLGFTEPNYEQGGMKPVSTLSRKTAAIWNILNEAGLKTNVVGWWPSHPAEPVNGVMVSNFYQRAVKPLEEKWPMAPGTVFPKKFQKAIAELRVHPEELTEEHILPFIPDASKIDPDNNKKLGVFAKILAEAACIHNSATYLMEETEWDFMAVYYDNIDHFSHAFMKYHPPQMKGIKEEEFELYKDVVNSSYIYHDMMLGRMLNMTDENTTIVLVSDHGFESGKNRLLSLPKEVGAPAYDHRSYGIFAAMGPGIKKDELVYGANLLDITPTLLHHFQLPLGKDMDGKPLINIFSEEREIQYIESWDDHVERKHQEEVDADAAAEALEMMIELGYIEKPDEDLNKAFERSKTENEFNLARVYLSSARNKEAAEILEKFFKDDPQVRYGIRLAIAYDNLMEYDKCIAIIDQMESQLKKPIQQLRALYTMALLKLKKRKDAWKNLEPLVNQRPQTAFVAERVGRSLMIQKKLKLASNYLDKALSYFPDNSVLHYLKGISAFREKKYSEASTYLLDSINLQFFNPRAHLYLGESLLRIEMYEEAFRALNIALAQKPDSKRALRALADIENKGFQFETAKAQEIEFSSKKKSAITKIENKKEHFLKSLNGTVYIVSGLPRSGTSMMMQMLKAGGAKLFVDEKRKADESNPKGYLEHDGIKKLGNNKRLIAQAKDKVVKVVSPQLRHLLPKFRYKIIFMDRSIQEVIQSQQKMSGKEAEQYPYQLHQFYEKQLNDLDQHFFNQVNVEVTKVAYKDAIQAPKKVAEQVANFLSDLNLDIEKMAEAVDSRLYRNKEEELKTKI